MSRQFLVEEIYNLIIRDGQSTYVYVISIFQQHDTDDLVIVVLDRVAVRPCGLAGPTDICTRESWPTSTTVEEITDSVPKADYSELLHPGIYRVTLDFDKPSVRDVYEKFGLATAPTRPETGTTNENENDIDIRDALDLLKQADIDGIIYPIHSAYVT